MQPTSTARGTTSRRLRRPLSVLTKMTKMLWIDRETYSERDLKEVGTARYAEAAEDLIVTYALDDDEVQAWDVTHDPYAPDDLIEALEDEECLVTAHNAWFDRMVHKSQPLPQVKLERWRCTMAQALSHALPASLDELGKVLGLGEDQKKMKEGKALIRLFTRPQPDNRKIRRATRYTHPEQWAQFIEYAKIDITAMRECARRMPAWNWDATAIAEWHLDQRINERGFFVDRELTQAGARAAATEKARIGVRFRELSGGLSPGQRAAVMALMNERYALGLENTTKDTFEQLLKVATLHPDAAEMMELSMAANKTSTAKYAALDPMIQDDGRFRGALQFSGAGRTRRWAGRGPQYHNLPSRGLPSADDVERYIEMLKLDIHDLMFKELMRYGSAALRGTVIATPGKKLVAADLSNIEGRKLAWFAQEEWKLQAFRDFDTIIGVDPKTGKEKRKGPDLYNVTAASILGGSPYDVSKKDRNVFGKVPDLACLGADTQVLTNNGLKDIVAVSTDDLLWDGIEWVNHEGLNDHGVRPIVVVDGITATPDHLINTQGTWLQAQELVSSASTLSRALATGLANLPSSMCGAVRPGVLSVWKSSVIVAPPCTLFCSATSCAESPHDATTAPRSRLLTHVNGIGAMKTYAPMKITDDACLIESQPVSTDVETRTTVRTKTTEAEVFVCGQHGSNSVVSFCVTCSRSMVGTTLSSNLIENESMMATNPETCDSSQKSETPTTEDRCKNCSGACSNSKRVYDLVNAGPRHRFLVRSNSGWLLVHNSGYQGGVSGYQKFAHAYGVRMEDHWGTIQRQIEPEFVEKAKSNLDSWGRAKMEELEISEIEWLASETCKLKWRARHPRTESFWYELQRMVIAAIQNPGMKFSVKPFLHIKCVKYLDQRWLVIKLPSGRFLTYFEPHLITAKGERRPTICYWGESSEEGKTNRIWQRTFTHGGKMTGNVCQTSARDVLMRALIKAEDRGYLPILSVHDEAITEVDDVPEFNVEGLVKILAENDPWTFGLPLAAAGFESYRYFKED